MIDASSDIVVATEVPPAPQKNYHATGKPIITGLPDIQNGVKWKIVIQHVIKGDLEVGEHVDVFLPITGQIGNHPVEFPLGSANFMAVLRDNSVILFLHRTGNNPDLETLPCFGSVILADPAKVKQLLEKGDLRSTILDLVDQNPQQEYQPFLANWVVTPGATIYETGSASVHDALNDPHEIAVVELCFSDPANPESGLSNYDGKNESTGPRSRQFKLTGNIRSDMDIGTTFTATPDYGLPSTPGENYLVFISPQNEVSQPFRTINYSVKLKPDTEPLDRQTSETVEEAVRRLLKGLDPRFY